VHHEDRNIHGTHENTIDEYDHEKGKDKMLSTYNN
jgi:hypothetical protein